MDKKEKITLKGYYDNLDTKSPRRAFIKKVAEKCGVTEESVKNWIFRGVKPQRYTYVRILENETGLKEEDLWA